MTQQYNRTHLSTFPVAAYLLLFVFLYFIQISSKFYYVTVATQIIPVNLTYNHDSRIVDVSFIIYKVYNKIRVLSIGPSVSSRCIHLRSRNEPACLSVDKARRSAFLRFSRENKRTVYHETSLLCSIQV